MKRTIGGMFAVMSIQAGLLMIVGLPLLLATSCDDSHNSNVKSVSGATKLDTAVELNTAGHTIEQENVAERLCEDNKPGAIKHLYVISSYSGQVLIYSTVKGKVTSSGKRLTPTSCAVSDGCYGVPIYVPGAGSRYTTEILGDDGTYGSSAEYVYWWDTQGVYHQHYVSGGQILHVSSQPIAVKNVIINMNVTDGG